MSSPRGTPLPMDDEDLEQWLAGLLAEVGPEGADLIAEYLDIDDTEA